MKVLVDLLAKDVSEVEAAWQKQKQIRPYSDVVVLIDSLAAATVASILFDRGASELLVCSSTGECKNIAKEKGATLVGESKGLPLQGFNYGMSAKRLISVDMTDKTVVMHARALPRALQYVSQVEPKHILLASLYNAEAAVQKAMELADEAIALVCCGFALSEDLDDSFTAGYLAARLEQDYNCSLYGAAPMAKSLLKAFPSPLEAFWHSHTGSYLRDYNIREDIAIASRISVSQSVPKLRSQTASRQESDRETLLGQVSTVWGFSL